jgi:hypothetical protein
MEPQKSANKSKIVLEPAEEPLDRFLDAHRRGGRAAAIEELRKAHSERNQPQNPPK